MKRLVKQYGKWRVTKFELEEKQKDQRVRDTVFVVQERTLLS